MAAIIWNTGERSVCDGWLGGQSAYTPSGETTVFVPAAAGNWGIALGTRASGVGSTKGDRMAQILEVGTSTANGYGRVAITRDQTAGGWPASTKPGSNYQTTASQKTFSFTGAPNPNGATLWFIAGSTTINQDNAIFGADTAATRTFANGDTERVTPTYQQT
jgi:hypothetical protein